jgi:hypothetical protein
MINVVVCLFVLGALRCVQGGVRRPEARVQGTDGFMHVSTCLAAVVCRPYGLRPALLRHIRTYYSCRYLFVFVCLLSGLGLGSSVLTSLRGARV